jgi:hypothetical protein
MTFKMKQTGFAGFPVQYPPYVVEHLNRVISSRCLTGLDLDEIGRAVSADNQPRPSRLSENGYVTGDGYTWFGRLDYELDGSKVAILFPWHQDFSNPKSKMDRSINVYSTEHVDPEKLSDLLERIGYQAALKQESLSTLRFVNVRN